MKCKGCEYPLWNLRSRTCPECGRPFAPSEFEFVPDSVRFCCPECGQDYYGTGPKGHLIPEAFDCVRCGKPLRMDDMVLLPTEGVAEDRTEVEIIPWLDRSKRGFFRGWLGTVWMALVGPHRLARAMAGDPRAGGAFWFALLSCSIFFVLGGAILLLPVLMALAPLLSRFVGNTVMVGVVGILCIPGIVAAVILLWALSSHVLLRLSGGTAHGPDRTLECCCYGSAASALLGIPCMGIYLSPFACIWSAVSFAVMLAVSQRVSKRRAVFAAITPPLTVFLGLVALILLVVVPGMRTSMASVGPALAAARAGRAVPATTRVLAALKSYSAAHGGPPAHGLALLVNGDVTFGDLYLDGFAMPPGSSVGGVDVVNAPYSPASLHDSMVRTAGAVIPAGAVAHRLGDMVFTYHGIDLSPSSTADPGLWLVVCMPSSQPSLSPLPSAPLQVVTVGTLGGSTVTIPIAQWPASLAQQNTLREAAGLGALPDPAHVLQNPVAPASQPSGGDR